MGETARLRLPREDKHDPWYARLLFRALERPDRLCYFTLGVIVLHLLGILPSFSVPRAVSAFVSPSASAASAHFVTETPWPDPHPTETPSP